MAGFDLTNSAEETVPLDYTTPGQYIMASIKDRVPIRKKLVMDPKFVNYGRNRLIESTPALPLRVRFAHAQLLGVLGQARPLQRRRVSGIDFTKLHFGRKSFILPNFRRIVTHKQKLSIYFSIVNNNLTFRGMLKHFKVAITNSNLTKLYVLNP
jgi:hypothetical protein